MTLRAPANRRLPAANSRLLAALCFSLLVHLSMPLLLSGGAARQGSSNVVRSLSVRVVAEPPAPPRAAPPPPQIARVDEQARAPRPRVVPAERPRMESPAAVSEPESAGGLPQAPDLTYYGTRQLDVFPRLLAPLDLGYRGKAADDGVAGRVRLLVMIDEVGMVRDVSVVEAEPASYFEDEASRALMAARFAPAYRNGRAVRSRMQIEVNYGLERGSP
jgi:periplasmic protein TonB